MGLLTNIKMLQKEICLKVGCFASFCHNRLQLVTMSAHKYAYYCPLLVSGMKIGLWATTSSRKDKALLHKLKE